MKRLLICAVLVTSYCAAQTSSMVAAAQERATQATQAAQTSEGPAGPAKAGKADGASSPDEMGNRRPPYRLHRSDVVEIRFNLASEFDQTVSIRPDGFIPLKGLDEMYVEGMTAAELRSKLQQAYAGVLHDPEITISLKDFEKPYFIATGAVARPGKY